MPDGRLLKKTISTDPRVAQLSDRSALLYVFSVPHLDVEGRILGLPSYIRGTVTPELAHSRPDDYTDQIVARLIHEWTSTTDHAGQPDPLVLWYQVNGVCVCAFRGFAKNQKLRRDRETPSRLPAPPPELLASLAPGSTSHDALQMLIPDLLRTEVEVQEVHVSPVVKGGTRARETPASERKALRVSQRLEQALMQRATTIDPYRGLQRGSSADRLREAAAACDLTRLAGLLAGADGRTELTLNRYRLRGCGEREFAMAAEALGRRRAAAGRPALVSEARFFCAELSRLLSERQAVA